MSQENPYLKQVHLLRAPLTLIKMETGKLTLESALSLKESERSTKLRVVFVRKYGNQNKISSIEVLPNNHDLEIEFNAQWMGMWDAIAQKHIKYAYQYVQYPNRTNEFFYQSHIDKGPSKNGRVRLLARRGAPYASWGRKEKRARSATVLFTFHRGALPSSLRRMLSAGAR